MHDSLIPAFINPDSGNADKAREALAPSGRFRVHDVQPAQLENAVRNAVEDGATRVLVAGGDGSIGTAAGVLCGTQVELAVLPGGTLNHFAEDIGIPQDLGQAVKIAAGNQTRRVDVARVGSRVFLNTSSIGVYLRFVRVREGLEEYLGYRAASVFAGLRTFFSMRNMRVELEIGEQTQSYLSPIVFVGVGERELQLPALGQRVRGGQRGLHVMVVRGRRRGRLLVLALDAIARGVRTASRKPDLDAFLVRRCTIQLRRPHALIACDGEPEMMNTPLEYRFLPDSLCVVAPQPAGVADEYPGATAA